MDSGFQKPSGITDLCNLDDIFPLNTLEKLLLSILFKTKNDTFKKWQKQMHFEFKEITKILKFKILKNLFYPKP